MCRFFVLFLLGNLFFLIPFGCLFFSQSLSLSFSLFLSRFDENAVQVELNVHKNEEAENQLMAESSKQTNIPIWWRAHNFLKYAEKWEQTHARTHSHTHERNCSRCVCHSSSNEEILSIKLLPLTSSFVLAK